MTNAFPANPRFALFVRYRDSFAQAWRQRHETIGMLLTADEAEFSPPAVALEERPISPMLRITAGVLVAFVVTAILWAVFARVDIVVNATGKVIPSDRTKSIASVDTASVRAIHVTEGQTVKAGDVLLELDAKEHEAERDKATGDEMASRLQVARARALIRAVESRQPPRLNPVPGASAEQQSEAQAQTAAQYWDFSAKLAQAEADIERYTRALPVAIERESIHEQLARSHDVSRDAWLAKKQDRLDLEGRLADARNARDVLIAQTKRDAYDAITAASRTAASSGQDALRAGSHVELLTLRAPVDGTVQQLEVHTVGGVVQAAQPLMLIVPAERLVEVQATLENRDVGFVHAGQPASVKLAAFDYTKYGTIPGHVAAVSADALENKERGLLYSVKVILDQSSIRIQGHTVPLAPGMAVDVEIKTGTRRVIEYVLSPLLRHQRESLRER
jgi:hemolysin D